MESKAEQYYPTYSFKPENRDIVLLEFDEAQKIANSQTKVYAQVTNVLIVIITALIPLFFNNDELQTKENLSILKSNSLIFACILIAFGGIILRYFVELQRQITINAKKAVSLRTMLGLDYGNIHLTLPNWRVEGATNPFVIKYFNGWLVFQSVPFWVITIGINAIWWLATKDRELLIVTFYCPTINWFFGNFVISVSYLFIFRHPLNELHETNYLNFTKIISSLTRIKLIDNFEYILYRAKLSVIELDRLKINYSKLKLILIDIEDKNFYSNSGISFKSLFRAFLSRFSFFRKEYKLIQNGGSTITMQLCRTLFIPSNQNKYLRKFIEVLLSFWLNKQFIKNDILNMYISSVRYEKGIHGLSEAIKYFFGEVNKKELSYEEAFFLVERLSNVTSTVNWNRINHLKSRISFPINDVALNNIYQKLIKEKKLELI
jgi:penicillin-binding protein 1A